MVDWEEVPDLKLTPARWPSGHRRADRRMLPQFEPAQDSDLGHYVLRRRDHGALIASGLWRGVMW